MATKDPWLISTVEQFAKDFPIGMKLTAKELGQWMIAHKGIEAPQSIRPKDPTWIKYVRERGALRAQFNRYSSSQTFVEESMFPPFEIHHIKGDEYQVLGVNDDIRKLMRDLLQKSKSGFTIKARKIDRLHTVAESQALPYTEVLRLERMKEDLNDTKDDLVRTLNKALRHLDRCEKDIKLLEEKGVTNGDGDDDE